MKDWEVVADNLKKAGWSLGWISAIDSERRQIQIVRPRKSKPETEPQLQPLRLT